MEHLGIQIDSDLNRETKGKLNIISNSYSRIKILVVPTNEELEIARETYRITRDNDSRLAPDGV